MKVRVVTRRTAYIDYEIDVDLPDGEYPDKYNIEDAFWKAWNDEKYTVLDRSNDGEEIIAVNGR